MDPQPGNGRGDTADNDERAQNVFAALFVGFTPLKMN